MKSKYHIWISLAVLIILASCSSQKIAYKAPLKEEGEAFLIEKMQDNESQFETYKAKGLVQLINNDKKNDLKVNIRIRKDSAIWVSISIGMGLEAARVLLTHDSVMFINRLEKTYFAGNYQFINQMINAHVDFDIVQALITGNDFKWYDYHDLKAKVVNGHYHLGSTKRRKLKQYIKSSDSVDHAVSQCMWLSPESYKIERIKIKEINNDSKKIVAKYSDFKNIDDQLLPSQYDIIISAQNDLIIDASLMKINLNKPITFPFNIPSKYKEIEVK